MIIKPIKPKHIYALTNVSEQSLSPDGTRLVFVKSRIDRERMENRSQIMIMSLPNGQPSLLTQGQNNSEPRFSPDGMNVSFIREDDKKRKQIWIIPLASGTAHCLTNAPSGVAYHTWSPDSRHLVFESDVEPNRLPEDHNHKRDPRVKVVQRIRYRSDNMGWRGDTFRHLFVVEIETGKSRQLTDGDGDDRYPTWAPDGKSIAFVSDRRTDRDYTWYTEAYVVPFNGGKPRHWSQGLHSVGAIAWSPNGTKLAVIGSDDAEIGDPFLGPQAWIFIIEPDKSPRRLTDDSLTPTQPNSELRWTNENHIIFLADSRGESFLIRISDKGGIPKTIAGGGLQFTTISLDAAAHTAVIHAVSPNSAGDLRMIDIQKCSQTQLTFCNQDFFTDHPVATMGKFTIVREGMEVESRTLMPPRFNASVQYPMVLDIHGGPHGRFTDSFNLLQQMLATAGYIVLAVNPRGSSSYSLEFAKAVLGDWGGQDYLDIMAAVDELCTQPYVDTTRLGIHGYSYGGFMSAWIIGHDTRFGAAVVGAPCINLASIYGTSDIGVSFGENQWGSMPKDAVDVFRKLSPLSYASDVKTPVLLLHGEEDMRCPIGQSEEYFVALRRMGKEVEFVRFPGGSHQFLRSGHPRLREEYLTRTMGWFENRLAPQGLNTSQDTS